VALAASAAVLTTTTAWWVANRPRPEVGSLAALNGAGASSFGSRSSAGSPLAETLLRASLRIEDGPAPGGPVIAVHSARLFDSRHGSEPAPTGLRIGAIGVDAPIVPVGVLSGTTTMEVPADVSAVGWYRFGPSPGDPGSSLLVGHVDSRVQGAGVFFHLSQLRPGDQVVVQFGSARSERFRVIARRLYPKGHLPRLAFTRTGRSFLTLVTCGGSFDQRTHHYVSNVVVFAVHVSD
jgi:sortase (surface protein transpeptidase)